MRALRKEFWMALALTAVVGCVEASRPEVTTAVSVPAQDEEIVQIEKLPEAERGPALAQEYCPVTQEKLGSMGMPIKTVVQGRTVFVCCKGCLPDLEKDPDTYLVRLKP